MIQETVFKGERPLNALEKEIVAKKTEAFESALLSLVPIKMLVYPYVKDFKRKLTKQKNLLLKTAKKVLQDPENEQRLIRKSERQYYFDNPFYSLVMLYIPTIFQPRHIQLLLKKFERRTRRYFRERVRDFVAFLRHIQDSEVPEDAPDKDFWQYAFPEELQFTGYLQAQYDNDRKTLKMLRKGSSWKNFYTLDVLNSFSISFIPLYRLFSRVWKKINDAMEAFMKNKVLDFYLIDTLSDRVYRILKEKSYLFKLEETFKVDPEEFIKTIHEPWFIMHTNPQKGLKVERIHPQGTGLHPEGERYTATLNLLLMKMVISWDVHYRYEGHVEEWWIVKSNYTKSMTGYCIYERTSEGFCHYYSITIKAEPSETLAALGELILPTLERITKGNTQQMMKNIKKYYLEKNSN
ncbi:MAG: hypothetical protein HWN65_21360 [Candidatus Helarchaeota archaeon]|nr:hypothetical protein [Candidatus Helarchaeota archaeon]